MAVLAAQVLAAWTGGRLIAAVDKAGSDYDAEPAQLFVHGSTPRSFCHWDVTANNAAALLWGTEPSNDPGDRLYGALAFGGIDGRNNGSGAVIPAPPAEQGTETVG